MAQGHVHSGGFQSAPNYELPFIYNTLPSPADLGAVISFPFPLSNHTIVVSMGLRHAFLTRLWGLCYSISKIYIVYTLVQGTWIFWTQCEKLSLHMFVLYDFFFSFKLVWVAKESVYY